MFHYELLPPFFNRFTVKGIVKPFTGIYFHRLLCSYLPKAVLADSLINIHILH